MLSAVTTVALRKGMLWSFRFLVAWRSEIQQFWCVLTGKRERRQLGVPLNCPGTWRSLCSGYFFPLFLCLLKGRQRAKAPGEPPKSDQAEWSISSLLQLRLALAGLHSIRQNDVVENRCLVIIFSLSASFVLGFCARTTTTMSNSAA
jgi:hypothetical protein